jgi:hypothetical protein
MVQNRIVYRICLGKPERSRLIDSDISEDNIKQDLKQIGLEAVGLDLAEPVKVQMAGWCEQGSRYSGFTKCGKFLV